VVTQDDYYEAQKRIVGVWSTASHALVSSCF
jgi:hypothetical protein